MRVLVVHAHPVETSFNRAIHDTVVAALTAKGHLVDDLNLYDEGFRAAMSRDERLRYHEVPENQTPEIKPYVDRLLGTDAAVFVFPVWNYGFPAILKGYFDRIFLPGVSFRLDDGKLSPNLDNIRKVAFITTYGGDRWRTWLMGDPPRKVVKRWGWATFRTPPQYLALYDMNNNGEARLKGFLDKVRSHMSAF
ncbi:MAG TPA: NAD(P)H-dependent oxidoreductase [Devosiaceae bacterium]|jgi:putative NADPH-quinone reductase